MPFTLVELIVVITIISMLASMLLPALSNARRQAQTITCSSNLKQCAIALISYTGDFDGYFPHPNPNQINEAASWFNNIDPYLTGKPAPSDAAERNFDREKQDPVYNGFDASEQEDARTYKMNDNLNADVSTSPVTSSSERFWRDTSFYRPERSVLLFDGRAFDVYDNVAEARRFSGTEGRVALRHGNRANVAFVGGHVRLERQPINFFLVAPAWQVNMTSLIWKPWPPYDRL